MNEVWSSRRIWKKIFTNILIDFIHSSCILSSTFHFIHLETYSNNQNCRAASTLDFISCSSTGMSVRLDMPLTTDSPVLPWWYSYRRREESTLDLRRSPFHFSPLLLHSLCSLSSMPLYPVALLYSNLLYSTLLHSILLLHYTYSKQCLVGAARDRAAGAQGIFS